MSSKTNKTEQNKKWAAIERGEIPDDYTNHFLSHFGFVDDGFSMEKQKERRDIYEAQFREQKLNNGFNSSE